MEEFQNHSENNSATYRESTSTKYRKKTHIGHCTHTSASTNENLKIFFFHKKEHYLYHKLQPQNSCNTTHPRNIVSFRHIIENALHKSDNNKAGNVGIR